MSICCRPMHGGDELSCEPVGNMSRLGWLPGTFVKFMPQEPTFSPGAVATIDRCSNTDWAVGFVLTGSLFLSGGFDKKYPNINDESRGEWGVDKTINLTSRDASSELLFDNESMLDRIGSGVVTVNLNDTGIHRIYTWEKYSKLYRETNGASGTVLDYTQRIGYPGLYVSDRGLLTVEKENPNSQPITFVLASQGQDADGHFLVVASA